jgi:hypothetical protein
MDAMAHETNAPVVDGEVVWSWRPDAGVQLATMRCIALRGDGGKKARFTKESTK